MGNYSYVEDVSGCNIDIPSVVKAIKEAIKNGELESHYAETADLLEKNQNDFGHWAWVFDGWKIQGYWYDSTVRFLYFLGEHMKDLTDTSGNDYIAMYEEQGFKFWIHFMKDDEGIVKLELEFMPTQIEIEPLPKPPELKT